MIVNDAATGMPIAIMDAAEITAARTAAASGACIRQWAPAGWTRAAIIGCGEQGRYHAEMIASLYPAAELSVYDPIPARVDRCPVPVTGHPSVQQAVAGAEVVVTLAPIVQPPAPTLRGRGWATGSSRSRPTSTRASSPRWPRTPTCAWPTTWQSATTRGRAGSAAGRAGADPGQEIDAPNTARGWCARPRRRRARRGVRGAALQAAAGADLGSACRL